VSVNLAGKRYTYIRNNRFVFEGRYYRLDRIYIIMWRPSSSDTHLRGGGGEVSTKRGCRAVWLGVRCSLRQSSISLHWWWGYQAHEMARFYARRRKKVGAFCRFGVLNRSDFFLEIVVRFRNVIYNTNRRDWLSE